MSYKTKTLLCSSKTNPQKLAVAIVKELAQHKPVVIDSLGAEAVNNAIKAICYAQDKSNHNPDVSGLFCKPSFIQSIMNNNLTVVTRIEVW